MSADHAATLRQAAAAMSADPQLIHRIPFTTLAGLLTVQLEDEARWADSADARGRPYPDGSQCMEIARALLCTDPDCLVTTP